MGRLSALQAKKQTRHMLRKGKRADARGTHFFPVFLGVCSTCDDDIPGAIIYLLCFSRDITFLYVDDYSDFSSIPRHMIPIFFPSFDVHFKNDEFARISWKQLHAA